MSAQFFCLSFAGDTGDTGDMKNLKIYTIIKGKPKSPDLLTRRFDSKGVPHLLDFLLLTLMTSLKTGECKFLYCIIASDTGDASDTEFFKT